MNESLKNIRRLCEEYAFTIPYKPNTMMLKDTDVYINPNSHDLATIRKQSSNVFRFTLDKDKNTVYLWDAGQAIHDPVVKYLASKFGIHKASIINGNFDPDGKYFIFDMTSNIGEDPDSIKYWIKQSNLPRLFGVDMDLLKVTADKHGITMRN